MGRKLALVVSMIGMTCSALAQGPDKSAVNPADSAWMIVATALVLLMTPALALFYGGMVHRKNVLNTMLMSFLMMGVISILWVMVGYSLAFGPSKGFIGDFSYLFGNNISFTKPYATLTISAALFMMFQMKFAIITPALISGAIAERVKFGGYVLFMILWSLLIYSPIACWVWNADGWLCKLGALDFAGGTVVHVASGVSALALCIVTGRRKSSTPPPNNITLTLLGAGLLWFGWFGFNAGSAYAINEVAVSALTTTHLAAAAGMVTWLLAEKIKTGRVTAIGGASGLVAGLVAITPAAGYVGIMSSIWMGCIAGVICFMAIDWKHKLGYDDALDVVGVHGVGGFCGAILTGVFADITINNAATGPALEHGRMSLVLKQVAAVSAVAVFAFVGSLLLGKLINAVMGLRVHEDDEHRGLDSSLHGESGYALDEAYADSNEEAPRDLAGLY